jgi:hypothetical protein
VLVLALRVVQRGVGGDAARGGEACAVARRASGVGEWLSRACSSTVGLTRWGVEGWRRGARVLVLALRVVRWGVGGDAARGGEACATARRASGVGEWLSRACSSTAGLTRWGVEGWRRGARVLVLVLRVVRRGVRGDAARGGEACAAARRASGVGEWLSRACSSTAGLTQRGVEGGVEGRGVGGASAGSARRGCWCWWGMRSGELVLVRH